MDQPFRPGPLMQIIDILRHDQQPAGPFGVEPRQRPVRRIGLHPRQCRAPVIVKTVHEFGIIGERLGCADILDPVPFPQSTWPAKRRDAAFGGNPCTGQDNDIVDVAHVRAIRRP